MHHRIVIIGAGTAGITVAARLRRAGETDVAIIDPAETHAYQPLWTLVGGGIVDVDTTIRPMADVLPRGVAWIREPAVAVDPDERRVTLGSGASVGYEQLVVAPGIQLDWDRVDGLEETLGVNGVSSNYRADLAPKTWSYLRELQAGRVLFTMPSGPIKCAGAPQKIAYLAADHFQRAGRLGDVQLTMLLPTPGMFGIPAFARTLEQVVERYGIDVRFEHELTAVSGADRRASFVDRSGGAERTVELDFDVMHAVPPQSAPDWIKASPLAADAPGGYVEVDKYTLQHVRHPDVFALGDAGSTPNSKTGAAIRKQAPVVVENLLRHRAGEPLTARYGGYASCPIVTSSNRMVLAEFDYSMQHTPSFPFIDTTKERYDMWLLKRYALPALYWHGMLAGRA